MTIYIKYCLLYYYRYIRQYVSADEVRLGYNNYIADILVDCKTHFHEIEIKQSKSDLYNGEANKQPKHDLYKNSINLNKPNCINKFSLCVPKNLEIDALEWIEQNNKHYGLIIYNTETSLPKNNPKRLSIIKSPNLLHKYYNIKLKDNIYKRLSSANIIRFLKNTP